MPYALAIFDLDGTLVDSFPWFLRTINDVADRFGSRRVREEDIEGLRHASTREIPSRLARHARRLKGEIAVEQEFRLEALRRISRYCSSCGTGWAGFVIHAR